MALNERLSEPSAVAAARSLFPSTLVGLAMRQHPGTAAAGYVVYASSALLDSFLLAQHPHRFSYEAMRRTYEAEEVQEALIALVDAGAALAETFEALLRALLLLPTTTTLQTSLLARMQPLTAELLPQLRAYQGALAAWTAVAPPLHVLSARLSSILEDLLRNRQRRLLLVADDEEEEAERNRRLLRIDDVIRAVHEQLSSMPVPRDDDTAAASSATTASSRA